ncbi:MAG: hypothetical protein WC791_03775 [Candidatus Paceibacterota bacterium]|jgi:hypothetical protein
MGRVIVFLVLFGTVVLMSDYYYGVAIVIFALVSIVVIGIRGMVCMQKFYNQIYFGCSGIMDTLEKAADCKLLTRGEIPFETISRLYRMIDLEHKDQYVINVDEQLVREFELKYQPKLPEFTTMSVRDRALWHFCDSLQEEHRKRILDIDQAVLIRRKFDVEREQG